MELKFKMNETISKLTSTTYTYTASGLEFNTQTPNIKDINIKDIGISLGNLCRYGGHTFRFYSVAEHSCLLFDFATKNFSKEIAVHALLHDTAEAYIGDIITPLKNKIFIKDINDKLIPIKDLEEQILKLIFKKLNFNYSSQIENIVKEIDLRIVLDESAQALNPKPTNWPIHKNPKYTPLNVTLNFWKPKEATKQFEKRLEIIL